MKFEKDENLLESVTIGVLGEVFAGEDETWRWLNYNRRWQYYAMRIQLHIVSFNFSGAIIWSYLALNTTRVSQGFGSFSSLFKILPCQHLPMRKVKRSRTMMTRCMFIPTTIQSVTSTVKTDYTNISAIYQLLKLRLKQYCYCCSSIFIVLSMFYFWYWMSKEVLPHPLRYSVAIKGTTDFVWFILNRHWTEKCTSEVSQNYTG